MKDDVHSLSTKMSWRERLITSAAKATPTAFWRWVCCGGFAAQCGTGVSGGEKRRRGSLVWCGRLRCPYLRQKGTSSLQTSVDGQKGDIAGYVTQSGGRLKPHVQLLYTRGGGGGGHSGSVRLTTSSPSLAIVATFR